MLRVILALVSSALPLQIACQSVPPRTATGAQAAACHDVASIDGSTRYILPAQQIDQVFQIDVWAPPSIENPLPVVYVLDGNSSFGMVANMYLSMMWAGDVPPALVVGIGYRVENPVEVAVLRSRDLLPTPEPDFAGRVRQAGLPVLEGVEPGGADAFLAFIENEVKPLLEERYSIDPSNETLVGYSYGGTFAFHVLLSSPRSFERYVIGSPVLARDGGELIEREKTYAKKHSDLDAIVFLSAGEYELENGIRLPTEAMMGTLQSRDYAGLRLLTHTFPEETHESAIAPTISRGLRAVFGTWPR